MTVTPAMSVHGNSLREPVLLPVVFPAAAQKKPFAKVSATSTWLNQLLCGVARSSYPGIPKGIAQLRRALLDGTPDEEAISEVVASTMERDRAELGLHEDSSSESPAPAAPVDDAPVERKESANVAKKAKKRAPCTMATVSFRDRPVTALWYANNVHVSADSANLQALADGFHELLADELPEFCPAKIARQDPVAWDFAKRTWVVTYVDENAVTRTTTQGLGVETMRNGTALSQDEYAAARAAQHAVAKQRWNDLDRSAKSRFEV